ncbi:cysteine protease [Clostridia bacterium]|nr:cysteine protease [Clostridia bacterium]
MIRITVYQQAEEDYTGFDCIGHAGYAKSGEDVICAGVSALVINTVNSIGQFTADTFDCQDDEKTGKISLRFQKEVSDQTKLLLKAMLLGLTGIRDFYGESFIRLKFESGQGV